MRIYSAFNNFYANSVHATAPQKKSTGFAQALDGKVQEHNVGAKDVKNELYAQPFDSSKPIGNAVNPFYFTAAVPSAVARGDPYYDNTRRVHYMEAFALRQANPGTVVVPRELGMTQGEVALNRDYTYIAEPGHPLYGLSGDELFAAIVRQFEGRWFPNGEQIFLTTLEANGLITNEQANAMSDAAGRVQRDAMRREEVRLGLNFDWDLFWANFRFSWEDVLLDLRTEHRWQDENFNYIELYTPEQLQASVDFVNRVMSVLN
jgi:hypothetical protein